MITYRSIKIWFQRKGELCSDDESLIWVLTRWHALHESTSRRLTPAMLRPIQTQIAKIATGKQRRYRQAVGDIIQYLVTILQWSVPEEAKKTLQDRKNRWFERLRMQSNASETMVAHYEAQKVMFVTS